MKKMIDFPSMVPVGENPNGVRTEGAGGNSHGGIGRDFYQQYSGGTNIAGPRWGGPSPDMVPSGFGVVSPDNAEGAQNIGDRLKPGR